MTLPTVYRESKGISALEALANAVPVVLPDHGAFPELIERSGGGVLHHPEQPADLAKKLKQLMQDPEQATAMGLRGQKVVERDYHAAGMAEKTLELYRQVQAKAVGGRL
jgi:glycosyltransferase involved in cell wall biosynthesis